jgi:hypothetical protein
MSTKRPPEHTKGSKLISKGKEKGFVTLDEIIFNAPMSDSPEEMDDLLTELDEDGIDLVGLEEAEPEEAERSPAGQAVEAAADPVTIYGPRRWRRPGGWRTPSSPCCGRPCAPRWRRRRSSR